MTRNTTDIIYCFPEQRTILYDVRCVTFFIGLVDVMWHTYGIPPATIGRSAIGYLCGKTRFWSSANGC